MTENYRIDRGRKWKEVETGGKSCKPGRQQVETGGTHSTYFQLLPPPSTCFHLLFFLKRNFTLTARAGFSLFQRIPAYSNLFIFAGGVETARLLATSCRHPVVFVCSLTIEKTSNR
jgi:hypothetical protein